MNKEGECVSMTRITENLAQVSRKIADAARDHGRDPSAITLVAVSKQQPDDRIGDALGAGLRIFGENRVQEAQERWTARRAPYPDLRLHLIGPLQTNKAQDAVELFDVIETVDRIKLADALKTAMDKLGKTPACLIQVNTGAEAQKAGVLLADFPALLAHCRAIGLSIAGLMCIPPVDQPPALHFALLKKLAAENGLGVLSMGMSHDFESAIALGATHIRIGTALFGARS